MAKPLIADDLWELLEPHLPPREPRLKGGRPAVRDRDVLTGIIFVLKTGIPWDDLPDEMGCGCGMTCFRRLRDWQQNGVWHRIQPILASRLQFSDRLDWGRANVHMQLRRAARRQSPDDVNAQALESQECCRHQDHILSADCSAAR